jgi:hypothetical protein
MPSIYLVEEKGLHSDYSPTVDEIISINPDKIICLCMNEVDAQLIFRTFFDKIKPWLKNNNKIVDIFFDKTKIVPDCLQILMSSENYTLHGCTNHFLLAHMRRMG